MKMKKVFLGIFFFCIWMVPAQAFASGNLSGIGILANEKENDGLDIYQVTLPTGDDLGIILDPEGLMSLSETGEYDSSWAGMVHMEEDGGALFVNRSSFPISVKVGISIDRDTRGTPSSIFLLEDEEYVDDGGWPQMYLTAIPGSTKIQTIDEFASSDVHIPVLANENGEMTSFSFLLRGADYVLDEETGGYVLADYEDNFDSASFILGGRVNKNADWSDYVGPNRERVIIHAVYTIQKQRVYDEESLYQAEEGESAPHALMKGDY